MNLLNRVLRRAVPAAVAAGAWCLPLGAQGPVPVLAPVVVDTAAPIVVKAIKPKTTGLAKFEGYVVHANIVQITARAKGNDMGIMTFPLSEGLAAKMQRIVDQGGYQFGDKVTIFYDPASLKAVKIKGKPSRAL
jgi:hypothetical protein